MKDGTVHDAVIAALNQQEWADFQRGKPSVEDLAWRIVDAAGFDLDTSVTRSLFEAARATIAEAIALERISVSLGKESRDV